ncbi:hypothetical protein PMIN04_012378, partial [Paraphaeosphaeria minitans]
LAAGAGALLRATLVAPCRRVRLCHWPAEPGPVPRSPLSRPLGPLGPPPGRLTPHSIPQHYTSTQHGPPWTSTPRTHARSHACLLLAFHPRPPACCSPSTLARLLAARLPPSPTRLLPCHAMPRPIAPAVDHAGRATPRPPSCTVTTFAARWSAVADAFFQFILNTPRDHAHHARQGVQA